MEQILKLQDDYLKEKSKKRETARESIKFKDKFSNSSDKNIFGENALSINEKKKKSAFSFRETFSFFKK